MQTHSLAECHVYIAAIASFLGCYWLKFWIPCSIPTCSLSTIEKKHHVTTFTFQILLCLNTLQKDCYMCVCTTAQALAYSPAFLHCLLSITVSTLFKKLCAKFLLYIHLNAWGYHTYLQNYVGYTSTWLPDTLLELCVIYISMVTRQCLMVTTDKVTAHTYGWLPDSVIYISMVTHTE